MQKYFPMTVATWIVPAAGMFFWVKITAPDGHIEKSSVERNLFERCLKNKVLIIPGGFFKAEGDPERGTVGNDTGVCYFRGAFAAVEENQLVEGIKRFGRSIREEFNL
jgi:aromatic amino acid aminotransferase I / 2-aminoadipate transaminase